jgi:hypothetical protein
MNLHWRAKICNIFFSLGSNRVLVSSSFSSVSAYPFPDFFLSSTNHIECHSVMIQWTVALHGTVLSGYFPRNFLQHSLYEECCTKILYKRTVYEKFLFNTILHFWTVYFTALETVSVCSSRTTIKTSPAGTGWLCNGLAASGRQPCMNKFLASWSKDNLDLVYLNIQCLICVNISSILVDLLSVIYSHRHAQFSTAALLVTIN